MKRFLIIMSVALVALLFTNASLYPVNSGNENNIPYQILNNTKDTIGSNKGSDRDWNEFDIIHSTTSNRPKSNFAPIKGFSNGTTLKINFYLNKTYIIKIEEKSTGDIVETRLINPTNASDILINISGWNKGGYKIYFYLTSSLEKKEDYYTGEFIIL